MTDNLLYAVVGACLGFAAGWSLRTMRYARQAQFEARKARRKVDKMYRRDDDGRSNFETIAIAIVVTLAAVATVLAGVAAQRSDRANDRVEELATCNQQILERTIEALNQRTAFSDASANARRRTLVTQRNLVESLLDPEAPAMVQIKLAQKYQRAVNRQLGLDDRNDTRRANYPYPTPDEIRECG